MREGKGHERKIEVDHDCTPHPSSIRKARAFVDLCFQVAGKKQRGGHDTEPGKNGGQRETTRPFPVWGQRNRGSQFRVSEGDLRSLSILQERITKWKSSDGRPSNTLER